MRQLHMRAEQLARAEQRRAIARIAGELGERLRGARVEESADAVALSGRGLARRWLVDPSLRFVTGVKR